MLEVCLLGKFNVFHENNPIIIPSRPAQALFAYSILTVGTPHRREKLAGLLWPNSTENNARRNLRHALWQIRKAMKPASPVTYLLADDLCITFNAFSDYQVDVDLLKKVRENATVDELISALSVYQGELLPGFYDEWVIIEREYLSSIFEQTMIRLISILQAENRWLDVLNWAERWIKLGQAPEPAYRALMKAHATNGDMAKVAITYKRCTKSLKEYGINPSEKTCTLYERLKAGKENRAQLSTIPQEETHRVHPISNVPTPLTSFIGREREVAEIVNLVGANRLVTLTGPGGVGKTRLAIQSSHKLMNKFIDGLWWVKLASLTDETLVPQVVARVLGIHEAPGENSIELIKRFLQQKQLLLVLDNCGHLLTACAQLTCELLAHCINLRILATSCEALDVTVETVYQVPTLSIPEMENLTLTKLLLEYEGVRLFVERASFIKSDFSLTEQNAAAVFQICRLLDGIPLALELAAVQISLLEVEQIADCINDRIYHISQETLTELPHHQVLQMLIDWSYELLSDKEKILFRRLAVFAGGFTVEDARSVGSGEGIEAERVSDLLSCMVNKLLITRQEQSGDVRYSIQETIRQYVRALQARVPNDSIRGY